MKRREFITLLGGAAATWPVAGRGQQARRFLIGFLSSGTKASIARNYTGFLLAMRELGYLEGRDFAIEIRYAEGDATRMPSLAGEIVRLKPDLIIASSTPSALAARRATVNIPIVGLLLTDPVGLGLVASEARPGTNLTGILIRVEGLAGKQLEISLDLVAGARKIGILINPGNPSNAIQRREVETAAAKLGVTLAPAPIRSADEIPDAIQFFVREQVAAVIAFTDSVITSSRRQIASFALSARLPTVFAERDAIEDGGLVSYAPSRYDTYQRAAYYVNRILKGERPADLPIEFPTKVELVINLATAKAIGVAVPPTLLARADEVIE